MLICHALDGDKGLGLVDSVIALQGRVSWVVRTYLVALASRREVGIIERYRSVGWSHWLSNGPGNLFMCANKCMEGSIWRKDSWEKFVKVWLKFLNWLLLNSNPVQCWVFLCRIQWLRLIHKCSNTSLKQYLLQY